MDRLYDLQDLLFARLVSRDEFDDDSDRDGSDGDSPGRWSRAS